MEIKKKKRVRSMAEIDRLNLDVECARQPAMYLEVAELHATAKADLADAESELELVEAELGAAIRANPQRYNIARISNEAVKEAIVLQQEYQDATRTVNKLKRDVFILQAGINTLEHRKQSLENMTYLQGQGYFAGVKEPRGEAGERVREIRKHSVRKAIE